LALEDGRIGAGYAWERMWDMDNSRQTKPRTRRSYLCRRRMKLLRQDSLVVEMLFVMNLLGEDCAASVHAGFARRA
jgi:hypothetical protein